MNRLIVVAAVCIGMLLATLITGDTGATHAPIDMYASPDREFVLLALGAFLFGSLAVFGYCVARYAASGDPKQIHYVDMKGDQECQPQTHAADQPGHRQHIGS